MRRKDYAMPSLSPLQLSFPNLPFPSVTEKGLDFERGNEYRLNREDKRGKREFSGKEGIIAAR
jgi:hypothetical protein